MKQFVVTALLLAIATPAAAVSPAQAPVASAAAAPAPAATPAVAAVPAPSPIPIKAAPPAEKAVYSAKDAVELAAEASRQFLAQHNLVEGRTKGSVIVVATELVERPVSHSDYERYRIIAFKKAEAKALQELVKGTAVSVEEQLTHTIFQDASSNAASFESPNQGRSTAASFIEKAKAVASAKLDQLLTENGIDPAQFAACDPDRQKELATQALITTTTMRAMRTLNGVSVIASFSSEDESGYAAVSVVVGCTQNQASVADSFKSKKRPAIPRGTSDIAHAVPDDPELLYGCYGTRLLNTAEGVVLVSYGVAANTAGSSELTERYRKRAIAERVADSEALSNMTRFISQALSSEEKSSFAERVRDVVRQSGGDKSISAYTEKAITDIFNSSFNVRASETLYDISTLKRWSLVRNGKEVVGVVKLLKLPEHTQAKPAPATPPSAGAEEKKAAHIPVVYGHAIQPDFL